MREPSPANRRSRRALSARCLALVGALGLTIGCSSESLEPQERNEKTDSPPGSVFPGAPILTTLYTPKAKRSATALAFNPLVEGELWVTLRQFPVDAPCTDTVSAGCNALIGEVAIVSDAGSGEPTTRIARDGNAWHFMRRPTSIAFGDNGNLATCPEARTGNYENEPADFAGPTLWSSDPAIFGVRPEPGQNGTHLDMLHSTPFCMGIAHEVDNVYWTFNGKLGALDRYDFNEPHVIGGEDHTDGELYRYVEGELLRVPEVPSHLVVDRSAGVLYVADTGNGRIASLDITAGTPIGDTEPDYDGLAIHKRMGGAELVDVVPPGTLSRPSGLTLDGRTLLVTDNATSTIHAFDRDGTWLDAWETGLPEGSLAGITVGPDKKIYLSDLLTGSVYRIDSNPGR